MDLIVQSSTVGDAVVLRVAGDIDAETAPQLRARLDELTATGARSIVIDLAEIGFLDSSALGVLVGANKQLLAHGGALKLAAARPNIRKLFDITRLSEIIPMHPSVAEATG